MEAHVHPNMLLTASHCAWSPNLEDRNMNLHLICVFYHTLYIVAGTPDFCLGGLRTLNMVRKPAVISEGYTCQVKVRELHEIHRDHFKTLCHSLFTDYPTIIVDRVSQSV